MSSEKHANLGLHKWASTDGVLRTEFNDNFGKVDEKVAETETKQKNVTLDVVQDLGITNDGTDVTNTLRTKLNSEANKTLLFPYSTEGFIINEVIIPLQKTLNGKLTSVKATTADKKVFHFSNGSQFIYDAEVSRFIFSQPASSDPSGTGTANNHFSLTFSGAINSKSIFNTFKNAALGVSFGTGESTLPDRQGKYNLAAFNFFDGIEKMAIQNIGNAYNRIIGNVINGKGANSHGVRITGYTLGADGLETPAKGNVVVGNIVSGTAVGYGLQKTAKFNSISASHSKDITTSLIQLEVPGVVENIVEFNNFDGVTFENVEKVIESKSGQFNNFNIVGKGVNNQAIIEYASDAALGIKGHNHYSGIIKDVYDRAVDLRYPNNRLDLDLSNILTKGSGIGVVLSTNCHFTTGRIKIDGCQGSGVQIYSNNNTLELSITNCTGTALYVVGTGNDIRINTDGNIIIGGTGNKVHGYVGGTVTIEATGAGTHDIAGLNGFSFRTRMINATTDASGYVFVDHNLKTTKVAAFVNHLGTTSTIAKISGVTSTQIQVLFKNTDGTTYVNQTVSFSVRAEATS
ncbi:hypothetical protein ACFRH9_28300 [Peribacillus butanolivorans]|uniref:hypothetical protein n=1 Tax=Peribacillus butanolivorans TaxID=421767 RepID=UPI00366AFD4D